MGKTPIQRRSPPETASLSRGNTARFVCNSSGEPPPVLHWLKDGQPIKPFRRVKSQSPGVLLINQLALEDAGYYQCIADNGLGTACATAKLTVIVREGLPSPPQHLSATPFSSTSALLTWEKPEYNSDQIIGYSVHCQLASGEASPAHCLHIFCGGLLSHGSQSPIPACHCGDAGGRLVFKVIQVKKKKKT
uniref:Ig-like domain-containing protein n=1 Tax=Labrus bergylta TaxID=56723 RepID=A0A3Q3EYT5_9LABR